MLRLIPFIIQVTVTFAGAVAFFDATRRSAQAFDAVGRGSKTAWLIGLGLSTVVVFYTGVFSLFGIIGTVAIIVYHVDQKPKLFDITRPLW